MAAAAGWVCPTCKRGVRPDVKTCDHGALSAMETFPIPSWPLEPLTSQPATMPLCGCRVGGTCGNVACPHRMQITCTTQSVLAGPLEHDRFTIMNN